MNILASINKFVNGTRSTATINPTPGPWSSTVVTDGKTEVGKPPVYPPCLVSTYLNAYSTNATIYTIINYLIQKFGSVPRYCYSIEDENSEKAFKRMLRQRHIKISDIKKIRSKAYRETPVNPDLTPEGKLAALTERPNSKQGQDTYYAEVLLNYELLGEAYIYCNRGLAPGSSTSFNDALTPEKIKALPVLSKTVLPSQYVNPIPSAADINTILAFRYEVAPGVFQYLRPTDVIHWKKVNPNYDGSLGTHLRGLAPLSAGLALLTQDNSATDAAVAMQQNQGAKGVLVSTNPGQPNPVQTSQIRNVIDSRINSNDLKGSVAFLGGSDYNYLNMGLSGVDLQLSESQQQVFIRLCNLFGIPPAIFLTETTYENLQQAGKSLLTNKILPACCSLRDEENRILIPSFGLDPAKYTTDIDSSLITELSEDMTELTNQLALSTWKTLNEKRQAVGDDPLEDPNMDKIMVPNNLIALDDLTVSDNLDNLNAFSSYKPTPLKN